ncbi:MAG: hypothetical protein R2722_03055 [Tessaracoccus sp.]
MSEPTGLLRFRIFVLRPPLLVGLEGLRVVDVQKAHDVLVVTMESASTTVGADVPGGRGESRRATTLVDIPCFARPDQPAVAACTWRCLEPACLTGCSPSRTSR